MSSCLRHATQHIMLNKFLLGFTCILFTVFGFLNESKADALPLFHHHSSEYFSYNQSDAIEYGKNFTSKIEKDQGLTAEEKSIAREAYQILNSVKFKQITEAHTNNKPALIEINERTISYDDAPFSGMTWFEKNGFNVGREAFKSHEELIKTVLHELHRLTTSKLRGSGNAKDVAKETKAAFDFAEKAYYLFE